MPDLGIFYVLLVVFVIVGTSNAVNLTDGLDGLAIGPVLITAATFMVFAYLAGNVKIASYLQIPVYLRERGVDGLLRGHGGGLHGVPLVQHLSGAGLHGRHRIRCRWARPWAPPP